MGAHARTATLVGVIVTACALMFVAVGFPPAPTTSVPVAAPEHHPETPPSSQQPRGSDGVQSTDSDPKGPKELVAKDGVEAGSLRDEAMHSKLCGPLDTRLPTLEDLTPSDPAAFCAAYGETARPPGQRPRIFYALMFGFEFDMLEVALSEAYPLVDHIFVTESTVTHSLKSKALFFEKIKRHRYERFLDKITHLVFTPSRRFKSGWDVERRQRSFFMRTLHQRPDVRPGDIVVANIDLDEIFSRTILRRYKFCNVKNLHFEVFHFRYHLNCIQEKAMSRYYSTVFEWPRDTSELRKIDLYKRRVHRKNFPLEPGNITAVMRENGALVWHMTAFGGVNAVFRKYENSPHRFVGDLTKQDIARNIEECIYQGERRFPVDIGDELPDFIARNKCRFRQMGWLRSPAAAKQEPRT